MSDFLQAFYQSDLTEIIAKSLLYSLWQASAMGLLLFLFLKGIPSSRSSLRHNLGLLSLLAVLLCWLGTLSILNQQPEQTTPSTMEAANPSPATFENPVVSPSSEILPTSGTVQSTRNEVPSIGTPERKPNISAHTILIMLWSIGVLLMTVRLFIALTGTQRHRKKSLSIEDPILLERFNKLCRLLGLNRKIIFAATTTLKNPGVIGIVKPMVLIPASMLTGFSSTDLEAVVAHELAHIRRHDYLFNLLQMVIESLFFFNPAVWWISHRIRMEREACCDAAAMQATGQKFEYAKLLLTEFGGTPATVPAFGNNKKAAAKERLLRIVQPHRKIDIKIGAFRLCFLLVLTTVGIVALAKTSDLAVETVARILTPKERVEKLIEIAKKNDEINAPRAQKHEGWQEEEITISGMVRTIDDSPLPRNRSGTILAYDGERSASAGICIEKDSTFSHETHNLGTVQAAASAKGYAPAYSPVFHPKPNQDITGIELILHPGFTATLTVLDENKLPVPNAYIKSTHIIKTPGGWSNVGSDKSGKTDANGCIQLEHMSTNLVALHISAEGFRPLESHVCAFKPNEPLVLQLNKGLIATGYVVDKVTGQPIVGAEIKLRHRTTGTHGWSYSNDEKLLTTSDASGQFIVNTLGAQETYQCSIDAPGWNRTIIDDIKGSSTPLRIEMDPEKILRGTLTGEFSKVGRAHIGNDYAPAVNYHYFYQLPNDRFNQECHRGTAPVIITNGVGYFEIRDFHGTRLDILPSRSKKAELIIGDHADYSIAINMDSDLVERGTQQRIVEFNFISPEGLPLSQGSVEVMYQTKANRESDGRHWRRATMQVSNNTGRVSLPTPVYAKIPSGAGLDGYIIDTDENSQNRELILSNTEPMQRTYLLKPAGGLHGSITDKNGEPLNNMSLRIFVPRPPSQIRPLGGFNLNVMKPIQPKWNKKFNGYYSLPSLPLGHTFVLIAYSQQTFVVSAPISLSTENAIQHIPLQLTSSGAIEGHVRLPDGSPAQGLKVSLSAHISLAKGHGIGSADPEIETDKKGYFSFPHVNKDKRCTYRLRINAGKKYENIETEVRPGRSKTYKLKAKK